jgi:hypothetical protein
MCAPPFGIPKSAGYQMYDLLRAALLHFTQNDIQAMDEALSPQNGYKSSATLLQKLTPQTSCRSNLPPSLYTLAYFSKRPTSTNMRLASLLSPSQNKVRRLSWRLLSSKEYIHYKENMASTFLVRLTA